MKYIDIEKLITEIKRRKELLENGTGNPEVMKRVEGVISAYNSILSFITTLQEEQTEIEKEAEISPSIISNFGLCVFNLSVTLTQKEMAKMNIAPFLSKKVNVIIKDAE